MAQIREIAEQKMVDLNANDLDAACRMVIGSARSMGLEVVDSNIGAGANGEDRQAADKGL